MIRVFNPCGFAIAFGLACAPSFASAEDATARPWPAQDEMAGPYLVHAWARHDGLPQDTVTDMAQTPDGLLWLTTFGGLVRFDGTQLRTYGGVRAQGTLRVRFTAVEAAADGRLWLGLQDGGVVFLDGDRFVRPAQPEPLGAATVWDLAAGPDGVLVGSSAGLGHFDGRQWRFESMGGAAPGVTSVAWVGADGAAWLGTAAGLELRAVDGRRTLLHAAPPDVGVLAVRPEPGRGTWFGMGTALGLWDGRRAHVFGPFLDDALPIWDIVVDPRGHLWVGSSAGLGDLGSSADVAAALTAGASPPEMHAWRRPGGVRSLLVDREGDVWVGTAGQGLARFWRQPFALEQPEADRHDASVGAIVADAAGTIWAVTACTSIARRVHDPAGARDRLVTAFDAGAGDTCIQALQPDPAGGLWAGLGDQLVHLQASPEGLVPDRTLTIARPAEVRAPAPVPHPQAAHILALAVDAEGAVWVGTMGLGALSLAAGSTRWFTRADGLASDRVGALAVGPAGEIWLGHEGASTRFRDGRFEAFTEADGHPAGIVRTHLVEADGTVWVGTYGGGVGCLREGRWGVLRRDDGLFDDALSHIVDDGHGRLWMNGNRGLFRVARADLVSALALPERSVVPVRPARPVRSFSFPTGEGNGTGRPAGLRAADGTLFFASIDGLVVVPPAEIAPRAEAPVPVIEALTVDGASLPLDGTAQAGPGTGDVVVQFVAARLRRPELLHFEYRLAAVGAVDTPWTPVPAGRAVHIAQARPGRHRFELRARDEDDQTSPAPSVVEFTIVPAWHQYTAVRLGGVLAVGLLVVLAVRRRLTHLRAQTAALSREVEQRRRAESALREEQAQTLALQAQLDHARRLEAIGRLAGGVAHDFNNLLTVAVASLRLLRDELRPAPGALVAEYLDELDDFSGSATRLTRQLLAFGRRQHLRPVAVDLAVIVDGLLPMLRRLLRSDVGVVVSAEPAPVRADRGQLEQAIVNLVANAAQAIVGSGQVHITVGPVEPAAAAARWPDLVLSGPHACLAVVDDGRGIPPEVLPSIFEPFFTTRPGGKGTGLGLASVHGFVEQSKGHIRV
ncbi:ATP-binding protein, partial [Myxococcota bacterium]|nr:ATP-binding protein [Myxococcota bacterium]